MSIQRLTDFQKELIEKMKNGYKLVHDLYSDRWKFISPDGVPLKRLTVLTAAALARQPGVRQRRGVICCIYYFGVEK